MSILKKYIEETIQDKKKMAVIGSTSIAAIAIISMIWLGARKNAYAVSVEGKVVGIIKTKDEAQQAYDKVVQGIDEAEGVSFVVNETLEVEAVHASKNELTSHKDLMAAISKSVTYKVEAYEIVVDGTSYATVSSQEEATAILKDIADQYAPGNGTVTLDISEKNEEQEAEEQKADTPEQSNVEEQKTEAADDNTLVSNDASLEHTDTVSKVTISNVEEGKEAAEQEQEEKEENAQDIQRTIQSYHFNQEVMIKNSFVEKEAIMTKETAEAALLADRYEIEEYELVEGDNIWDLAVAYHTTQERIMALNAEIEDETKMQIGQMIKLEKGIPILSITTIEEATFKELIPGEIQYKPSEHFYEGFTKVIVEGNDGVKELTVEVTKENGEEVSRKTVSEKILSEAKVTVIAYGVKEKETEAASSSKPSQSTSSLSGSSSSSSSQSSYSSSGSYIHPLKGAGTQTSGYGPRWGTYHYGLDFAASAGTPIYAARAGKVIYSAYNTGGYGKLIIIEHSDGSQTYYAHCSSLYVQVGEKVSQGEKIAGVGSTGDSTGNHLHFEIRINGRPVNPANYL